MDLEKKVRELIGLMNSISSVRIPAMKPVFELFNMTMDDFMVDYLIEVGTSPKSKEELKDISLDLDAVDLEQKEIYDSLANEAFNENSLFDDFGDLDE